MSTASSTLAASASGAASSARKKQKKQKKQKTASARIDAFRQETEARALELIETFLPTQIAELTAAMERPEFSLDVTTDPHFQPLVLPSLAGAAAEAGAAPPPAAANPDDDDDDGDGLTSSSDASDDEDMALAAAASRTGVGRRIKSNPAIARQMAYLRPAVKAGVMALSTIKLWIQLLVPRIEDGNNFGVGVQEEVSQEVDRVETACVSLLQANAKYFRERAKVAENLAKYPDIRDFSQALAERDELEYFTLRLFLQDLRDNYATLLDLIQKNRQKILKPKGEESTSSVMMM